MTGSPPGGLRYAVSARERPTPIGREFLSCTRGEGAARCAAPRCVAPLHQLSSTASQRRIRQHERSVTSGTPAPRRVREKLMFKAFIAGAATLGLATPAAAQTAPSWTGFYVGGRVGYVAAPLNTKETVLFDKNLDGTFGDTVTTAAGANAFSPGFCNGAARSNVPAAGCRTKTDGLDYAVNAGADVQLGNLVVGGLVEYGRSKA